MNRIVYLIFLLIFMFGAFVRSHFLKNVPGIAVIKPARGDRFRAGRHIVIKFCPDRNITSIESIDLVLDAVIFSQTFATNVRLRPPKKCYKFKFTLNRTLAPDSRYRVLFSRNGQFVASSGSFFIDNPKSGLIITKPDADDKFHCGDKLKVKWKDPLKLYKGLTFNLFVLGEFGSIPVDFSPPATNVPVSPGKVTVTIPKGLVNNRSYNVVVFVLRNGVNEEFYSDTFTISGC